MREAKALVYVEDPGLPQLSDDDTHHLSRVLRLREGEGVIACDGAGAYVSCRVRSGQRRELSLEPAGPVIHQPAPEPRITVGFSLLKAERSEWAVEKLTEAGVDEIVPFISERTVVGKEEGGRRERRLLAAVRQAAMQSRRTHLPLLRPPVTFRELISEGLAACLAEPGGLPPSLERPVVLVGPEGGFSPAELEITEALGLPRVGLGDNILRGETAAVAAGVVLAGLRAGLLSQAPPPG